MATCLDDQHWIDSDTKGFCSVTNKFPSMECEYDQRAVRERRKTNECIYSLQTSDIKKR